MAIEVARTAEVLGNFPLGIVAVKDGATVASFKVVANHAGELNMVAVDENGVAEVRRILGSVAELDLEGIKPDNLSAYQVYLGQARVTSTGGSMDKPGRLALHIYGRDMRTGEALDRPQIVGEETLRSLFAWTTKDKADFAEIIKVGYDTDYVIVVRNYGEKGEMAGCRLFFLRAPAEVVREGAVIVEYDSDAGLVAFLEFLYRGIMAPEYGRPIHSQIELGRELEGLAVKIDGGELLTQRKRDAYRLICLITAQLAVRAVELKLAEGEDEQKLKWLLQQWSRKYGRSKVGQVLADMRGRESLELRLSMWRKLLMGHPALSADVKKVEVVKKGKILRQEQDIDTLMKLTKEEFCAHLVGYVGDFFASMNEIEIDGVDRATMTEIYVRWLYLAQRTKLYGERFGGVRDDDSSRLMALMPYKYEKKILGGMLMNEVLAYMTEWNNITYNYYIRCCEQAIIDTLEQYRFRTGDNDGKASLKAMRKLEKNGGEGAYQARGIMLALEALLRRRFVDDEWWSEDIDAIAVSYFILSAKILYAFLVDFEEENKHNAFGGDAWIQRLGQTAWALQASEERIRNVHQAAWKNLLIDVADYLPEAMK